MGAVSGVYLKYVGLSVTSYGLLYALAPSPEAQHAAADAPPTWILSALAYMSVVNGLMAMLFRLEQGMEILGKEVDTGEIPWWSYIVFVGFHLPNSMYTSFRRLHDSYAGVHMADEVKPGWWIGGRYANTVGKPWAGIVDLTCEFPETCVSSEPGGYHLVRCWDGVPPTAEQIEEAARFAVERSKKGNVIVHCAHGRGRSTTVLCACLVKAGYFKTWQDALPAIKAQRKVVKLNSRMRQALDNWQASFANGKKAS